MIGDVVKCLPLAGLRPLAVGNVKKGELTRFAARDRCRYAAIHTA